MKVGGRRFLLAIYNDQRLIVKIIIAFVLAAVVPIVALQSFSFALNTRNLSEKIDEIMLNNLTTISEQVHLRLEVYKSIAHQIQMDNAVVDNLPLLAVEDTRERAAAYNAVAGALKQYHSTTQGIRCISVVCPDGSAVIYDADTDSSIDNVWREVEDIRETQAYRSAIGGGVTVTPTTRFTEEGEEAYLFHLSRAIYDLDNIGKGPVAVVILSVHESVLNALCNNPGEGTGLETSLNFIMDGSRHIITYPDAFFTGIRLGDNHQISDFVRLTGYMQNKRTEVNALYDPETGWYYYNVYDQDHMLRDLKRQQMLFLALGLGFLFFSVLLMVYTTRKISISLGGVMNGIQQVQAGNLDVVVPVVHRDEIGEIAENFNEMTGRVKASMANVAAAVENQKNAEIRALEAQINPHFMYNTLDSINWMAIDRGEYEISRALRDFGAILRYSIGKGSARVPLWEETDWIEKYVSLLQIRFGGVFDYVLNLDGRVREAPVHRLLLQPFVENAILHGFKGMEGGGMLRMDIAPSEDGASVVILIEDNGRGMSPELARQFNEMEAGPESGKHVGIANVFGRLRMYYGNRAHWNITSIDGLGTIVTLVIPAGEEAR